jgi:hypothetical protein
MRTNLAGTKKFLTADDADITDIQRSRALAFRVIQGINFSSAGTSNLYEPVAILLAIYKDPFWKPLDDRQEHGSSKKTPAEQACPITINFPLFGNLRFEQLQRIAAGLPYAQAIASPVALNRCC